jgi:hypothetical protein
MLLPLSTNLGNAQATYRATAFFPRSVADPQHFEQCLRVTQVFDASHVLILNGYYSSIMLIFLQGTRKCNFCLAFDFYRMYHRRVLGCSRSRELYVEGRTVPRHCIGVTLTLGFDVTFVLHSSLRPPAGKLAAKAIGIESCQAVVFFVPKKLSFICHQSNSNPV